ncbi:hypothetical protein D3C85_1246110 [compost metagenome]
MYSVEMRVYLCHPETCGHEEHFTWWVIDKDKFEYLEGFDTREEAEFALEFWRAHDN